MYIHIHYKHVNNNIIILHVRREPIEMQTTTVLPPAAAPLHYNTSYLHIKWY